MATRRTFLLGTGGAAAAGLVSVPALAEPRVERGGRPDPDLGRFTIAVIPDTQYLFDRDRGDSAPLDASLRYLLDHAASDNIVFISHLGDLTENGLKSEIEDIGRSFRVLDRRRVGYSVLAGNHDLDPRTDDQRGRTPYLDEFGPHRFRQSPTFRGASADGYNSFHVFKAAGREWLVLALDWRMSAKGFDLARDVIDVRTFSPWLLGKKSTNALERVEIERTGDVDRFSVPIDFARRFAGFAPVPVRPQRPVRDVVIEGTVAYWRYDSLKDLSGNGNDLRQVGTLAVADDHHADSPSRGSRVFGKNTDVTLDAAARQMFRPRCPWTWSPGGGCATAPACRTGAPNCCRRTSNRARPRTRWRRGDASWAPFRNGPPTRSTRRARVPACS